MEVLEQGKIKITGADCLGETAELEIKQEFGRHGRMKATVWLQSEDEGRKMAWESIGVCVVPVQKENAPIFSGRVRHACLCRIKGQPAVRLEADSYTILLDQEKKDRSFQKEARTFGDLVIELLNPHGGVCIWGGEGKDTQVGRFLMQYKETDWQFLCRVASLQGYAVIPEVRFPGAKLYIGVPETREAGSLESDAWRVRKNLAKTSDVADNSTKGILSGGTEIIVEERYEDYCVGDAILFHGERLIIGRKLSRFVGSQWMHDYTLRKEAECHVDRFCNPNLSGAAIKGTVLETTLTSSRLALETDGAGEEQESFHIQPVYYAGGGKGYSGQPEKGDTQYLYFPTMREEDRYIIGGADAGKERIDALIEAVEREQREEEEQESISSGVTGSTLSMTGTISAREDGSMPVQGGIKTQDGSFAGMEDLPTAKNWSTPGGRKLVLGENGIRLTNGGKGRIKTQGSRITVLKNGITVWSNGNLKLEAEQIHGRSGQHLALTAGDCIWMYSGESGILVEPESIQMKSPELGFESPKNEIQELPESNMVFRLLQNYEKKKSYPVPTVASDGSMVRRTGYEEILYSDEIYEYFENNVLGTEGYENAMEQPPDLIYQCWLDDVYGRSDLGKFWDYTGSVEGIQTILAVAGIFWNGADLINMVISLCMGDVKAAFWYGVCALPFIGEKLGVGEKWLTLSTKIEQVAEENKVVKRLTLVYKVPAGKLDDFVRYMRDVLDAGTGLQGDVIFLLGGKEVMDGGSTISFRICEEVSGEIYEDVWRLGDESSWLLWEMPAENDVSYSGEKWRDFFEAKYGKENVQWSFMDDLDDAEDILSSAKGLDGSGGRLNVDGDVRVNAGGTDTIAYHSVGGENGAKKIQSVLDGIDISYTSPESRFGQGFYVAADGKTTVAELAYHGTDAKYSIRYDMNLEGQKVLDLTDPQIANEWGFLKGESSLFECQNIAEIALDEGYNVIKVHSYRDAGINYIIYDNFDEILQPQMVTPIGD